MRTDPNGATDVFDDSLAGLAVVIRPRDSPSELLLGRMYLDVSCAVSPTGAEEGNSDMYYGTLRYAIPQLRLSSTKKPVYCLRTNGNTLNVSDPTVNSCPGSILAI